MFKIRKGAIYSVDDVNNQCFDLVQKIKSSNYHPDIIVGISDGGIMPAKQIGELLSVPVEILNVSRPSFVSLFKRMAHLNKLMATLIYEIMFLLSSPKIRESLKIPEGKNILLVDDMAHTGKTIRVSVKYINKKFPKSIKTAVISNKNNSQVDYFVNNLEIIFPWSKDSPHYDFYVKNKKQFV